MIRYLSWNPSSSYGNNIGYCIAIYDGCNSEILLGPPSLLSATISLEGRPYPKSLVIRAASSNTVKALYCRADLRHSYDGGSRLWVDLEDSDKEVTCGMDDGQADGKDGSVSDKRKKKRYIMEDSTSM
nr:hypothetical protein [Tanacetum cinerariifolium]